MSGDGELRVRVSDYIDDKLQEAGDVDGLDMLLANVHAQHDLLKQQLHEAQRNLQDAKNDAQQHHAAVQKRGRDFRAQQADIDRRLLVVTGSDTDEEAVPRFESALGALHRFDVAHAYMQLLQTAHSLSDEAQNKLQTSNEAALDPYKQLCALYTQLLGRQDAAEGAAPQLLHHVGQLTSALRTRILDAFSADLDKVLAKIRWPSTKIGLPPQLEGEWEAAVVKLLDLQSPELLGASQDGVDKSRAPAVLFPLEVLVQPLEMRFRYHFEGDKPTNRVDRPEYFLSHITTLVNDYSGFMLDHVQPVLLKQFRGTDIALNSVYMDATSAFITALLPMVRSKVGATLPQVAKQPQLLSHFMHELMQFDTTIRDEWRYDGGYGTQGWKGLTWEVLVQGDWFGRWLQVEKDFALARYQSITEAPDFGDLDYESVDPKATKPTKGAIRVNDLLETITDRYRPLASFSQKLRFLIDIQIAIFDQLHERLQSNLEAYLAMTTTIARSVGGVSKEEQGRLLGMEGLERLCKTYGSAEYLERAMRDWSDDVFFLDLWEELQDRAREVSSIGSMAVTDVAERTSKSVGGDSDGGGLFDETAGWYSRLRIRSEKIIIDTLSNNVREALRPYRHANPWATLSEPSTTSSALSPSAELDALLSYLTKTLGFLSRALAAAPMRRITRAVLGTVSSTIWDNVLNRHRFSTAGAAQLSADLAAICRVVDTAAGASIAEAGLAKCLDGARLIGLPVVGSKSRPRPTGSGTTDAEDDWGAWAEGEDGEDGQASRQERREDDEASEDERLGLWQVEKRLFADNESAREVLDALGVETLTESEARGVFGRRIELAG